VCLLNKLHSLVVEVFAHCEDSVHWLLNQSGEVTSLYVGETSPFRPLPVIDLLQILLILALRSLSHCRSHVESLQRVDLISRVNCQSIVALLSESETTVISEIVPHLWLGHDSVSYRRVGVVSRPVELRSLVSPSIEGVIQHINQRIPFTFNKSLLHLSFIDFASFSSEQITVDVLIRVDIVWLLSIVLVLLRLILVSLYGVFLSPQDLGSLHGEESLEFALFVHDLNVVLDFGILLVKFVVGK
jgi:hypothetical protein